MSKEDSDAAGGEQHQLPPAADEHIFDDAEEDGEVGLPPEVSPMQPDGAREKSNEEEEGGEEEVNQDTAESSSPEANEEEEGAAAVAAAAEAEAGARKPSPPPAEAEDDEGEVEAEKNPPADLDEVEDDVEGDGDGGEKEEEGDGLAEKKKAPPPAKKKAPPSAKKKAPPSAKKKTTPAKKKTPPAKKKTTPAKKKASPSPRRSGRLRNSEGDGPTPKAKGKGKAKAKAKSKKKKASGDESPAPSKRGRGRPRKSPAEKAGGGGGRPPAASASSSSSSSGGGLEIDPVHGTIKYGRRTLYPPPKPSVPLGPPRAFPSGSAYAPHPVMMIPGMVPRPWMAAAPAPAAAAAAAQGLAPPLNGPAVAASATAAPSQPPPSNSRLPPPFPKFYAVRKSARGCPVSVSNGVFTSWDDCRKFVRPPEAATKKGRGKGKKADKDKAASAALAAAAPTEGEDGKGGKAEFGVFNTLGEAFMYLAAMTKEGAAAMASVAVATGASLRPTLPRPTEGDEDEEEAAEDEEGKKSEDEDEEEEDEEVEDGKPKKKESWVRVYDGTRVEAEPPEPQKMAKRRKRKSPDDGNGEEGSDVEGGEEFGDGAGSSPPTKKRRRSRVKKEGDGDGTTPEKLAGKKSSSERSPKPRYLTKKWLAMYEKLRAHKEEHGTSDVRTNCRDELYKWVREQRVQYHFLLEKGPEKSGMHTEKIRLLKELDFDFDKKKRLNAIDEDPAKGEVVSARPLSEKWLQMLERARQFREKHGSLDALDDDRTVDPEIFGWIREQRYYHRLRFHGRMGKNKEAGRLARVMHDEKIRRLEEIGLDFGAKEAAREKDWEENFEELKRFKDEHGHCNVPLSKKGQVRSKFQTWCVQQRIEYKNLRDGKKTKMTLEKMTRLNDVGFAFLARERYVNWDTRLEQARAFVAENGHCNIPVDHPVLGEFTCKMRRHYKLHLDGKPNSITPHKIQQLNELGFVWLAGKRWVNKGPRKPWEERFQDLLEYKEVHGHTNVPQSYQGLGVWVKEQRKEYKKMVKGAKTKMSAEKALKLSEVGFLFEVRTGAAGGAGAGAAAAASDVVGARRADAGATEPDFGYGAAAPPVPRYQFAAAADHHAPREQHQFADHHAPREHQFAADPHQRDQFAADQHQRDQFAADQHQRDQFAADRRQDQFADH